MQDQWPSFAWTDRDSLTGLFNRRFLRQLLRRSQAGACDRPASCLLIGLDRRTKTRQSVGAAAATVAAVALGDMIRQMNRGRDLAMRLDEQTFLIVQPATALSAAWVWADRIRRGIERLNIHNHPSPWGADAARRDAAAVTVSVGVADGIGQRRLPQTIRQARDAWQSAVDHGANRVRTWAMLAVDRLVADVQRRPAPGPVQRRELLLRRCSHLLGPTQLEHLTTHSQQVSDMAQRLGRTLRLDEATLHRVRLAGLFHDIGKCVVPEDLLAKPACLTDEEWRLMDQHAEVGARICARLGGDALTSQYVRHHHAWYDRRGAQAADVPLGARLVCVADALVTMTTTRSYRTSRPMSQALAELTRHRGSQFDPRVVDAAPQAAAMSRAA